MTSPRMTKTMGVNRCVPELVQSAVRPMERNR